MTIIPTLEKLRQEDREFKASLDYKVLTGQTGRGIRGKSGKEGMEEGSEKKGGRERERIFHTHKWRKRQFRCLSRGYQSIEGCTLSHQHF